MTTAEKTQHAASLHIAPNLVLPLGFVMGTHAILGIKGSGKDPVEIHKDLK